MRHTLLALSLAAISTAGHATRPDDLLATDDVQRVAFTAAAFEAEHPQWQKVADGVYQHIDAATGAISSASIGPLGFRHDLAKLELRIAVVRGELETLTPKDHVRRTEKQAELAELNAERRFMQQSLAKAVSVFYQSPSCNAYFGTFRADFSKVPLGNGGNRGSVLADAQIGCESPSWCGPAEAVSQWTGGARSKAVARNAAATVSDIDATPIIPVTEIGVASAASTQAATDPNCTLTASAAINTTEFQGCWIYFNRSETRYCSQVPY